MEGIKAHFAEKTMSPRVKKRWKPVRQDKSAGRIPGCQRKNKKSRRTLRDSGGMVEREDRAQSGNLRLRILEGLVGKRLEK